VQELALAFLKSISLKVKFDKLMHSNQGTPKTNRQDACSTNQTKCIFFVCCIFFKVKGLTFKSEDFILVLVQEFCLCGTIA